MVKTKSKTIEVKTVEYLTNYIQIAILSNVQKGKLFFNLVKMVNQRLANLKPSYEPHKCDKSYQLSTSLKWPNQYQNGQFNIRD